MKKILEIPIKYIVFSLAPTVLLVIGFEVFSYISIRYVDGYDWYKKGSLENQVYFLSKDLPEYRYNRILSGYRVVKSRPGHKFKRTIKTHSRQPDAVIDRNGFITDLSINREKPNETIRVFITGGSTALGAGQNNTYQIVKEYPHGVYSFPISISGRVKYFLQKRFPDIDFEIINASMMGKKFHQSYLHYIEQLSRFSPNIVVNIDGQNDAGAMWRGNLYEDLELEYLEKFIKILPAYQEKPLFLKRTYSYQFLYRVYLKGNEILQFSSSEKQQVDAHTLKEIFDKRGPFREYSMDEYLIHEDYFKRGCQRFLQTIRHYHATLESDGVRFVFMLQPMLQRSINKPLSGTEKSIFRYRMHSAEYDTTRLMERFFIDKYISPQIQAEAEQSGFSFIDANKGIADLPEGLEFFTDYCHLTVEGNDIVAKMIAEEIALIVKEENMHLKSH